MELIFKNININKLNTNNEIKINKILKLYNFIIKMFKAFFIIKNQLRFNL